MSNIEASEISKRAYGIWLRAGRPDGKALEHWLQAEAELTQALAKIPAVKASAPMNRRSGAEPRAQKRRNNRGG
jgi:hypothetical protein